MDTFTYKYYRELLKEMKEINNIYTFKDVLSNIKSGMILRHDIDFDIEKAYILSKIEEEESVKSTYFVLTTSELYNPNSRTNRSFIRKIHDNGFEIGLHFDPRIYEETKEEELITKVIEECSILENIIEDKILSISLHCPSIYNRYPMFVGYKNAYSTQYFNPDLYISDSCKDFRGKDLFNFIKNGEKHLIQIVLHPIHFSVDNKEYIQIFNEMFEKKINDFDKDTRLNKTYSNEIGNEKLINKLSNYINSCKG